MNYKNRAQRVAFNEAADWLIGVKFERGDKVTLKCATPCLYRVRQNHLICLRAFANTRSAIVRSRMHLLNFSFAFIVFFFSFFFLASMDDDSLMCKRETYVRELVHCIRSSTRRIPSVSFFGIKHFRYLGPILHACAPFITSCNITPFAVH